MIQISDAEKAKWESGKYQKSLKLYFPYLNLTIENSDIYGESMSLKESLFDGNGALEITGCVASCFSIEIRHQSYDLKNLIVIASIRIDNGNWIQLFRGNVDSVETVRDRSYQKLTCYDPIQYLATKNVYYAYDQLNDTFTVKQLRDKIFTFIGIGQKTQTLPNDSIVLNKTIDSGEISFIDAVKAICQLNGMFGIMNRDNQFEYRQLTFWDDDLPYPSAETFPSDDLFPGTIDSPNHTYIDAYQSIKYEDYEVALIDKVTVRDGSSDEEAGVYGSGDNNYLVDSNIFCGELTILDKEAIATNLYNAVSGITYRPFDVSVLGRPYVEVGDAVSCYVYDYSTGSPVTYIMPFNVLTRTLKGIQWLRDEYTASGSQLQPEVILEGSGGASGSAINEVKDDIKDLKEAVEDLDRAKQDFIDLDILQPTWDAPEGHITLNSIQFENGKYAYQWFRREGNTWRKMYVAHFSQTDLVAGDDRLETGEIYLVYE